MIARLLDRLRYRRITGADIDTGASGDTAHIGVYRRRRRPIYVELPRADLLDLADAILNGEPTGYPPHHVHNDGDLPERERELLERQEGRP